MTIDPMTSARINAMAITLAAFAAAAPLWAQPFNWTNVQNFPGDLTTTGDAWSAVRIEDPGFISYRCAADDFELTQRTRITRITFFSIPINNPEVIGGDWYIYEGGAGSLPGALVASGAESQMDYVDTGLFNSTFGLPVYADVFHPDNLVLEPGRYFLAFRSTLTLVNNPDSKNGALSTRWANLDTRALWSFDVLPDGTFGGPWVLLETFNLVRDQEWAFTIEGEFETGLTLSGPFPGDAGVINRLDASGATAGERVYFVYGFADGTTNVPGCPGASVSIRNAILAGSDVADVNGDASFSAFVPGAAAGQRVLLQAVDHSACTVSNRISHVFN